MRTGNFHISSSRNRRENRGFTLVELLIVIVILGILATVTVFAVRGVTDKGQDNAEATELRTFETAVESYWALNGNNPADAQTLVSAELLSETPQLYPYADLGDGTYTLTNVRTGDVTTLGATGSGAPAATPGPNVTLGTPTTFAGFPAYSVGFGPAYVVVGGAVAGAQWDALVAANTPVIHGRQLIFVDIANITTDGDAATLAAADSPYPRAISVADDVADFAVHPAGGPDAVSLVEYLVLEIVSTTINDGGTYDVATMFNQVI